VLAVDRAEGAGLAVGLAHLVLVLRGVAGQAGSCGLGSLYAVRGPHGAVHSDGGPRRAVVAHCARLARGRAESSGGAQVGASRAVGAGRGSCEGIEGAGRALLDVEGAG
ncbi:MAG: hypothetical protein ACK56I_34040, partial [bacterium]